MDITNNKYYNKDFEYKKYYDAQIKRHAVKKSKKRSEKHYLECSDILSSLINDNSNMICLGTRNNHERDVWRKGLKSKKVNVFSLDISPNSKADFIMDFNNFSDNWKDKWDIIFSNSLDHSIDASVTFKKWIDILKPNGIMIIGFDKGTLKVNEADCCDFDEDKVDKFMKNHDDFEFLHCLDHEYRYYFIRKR